MKFFAFWLVVFLSSVVACGQTRPSSGNDDGIRIYLITLGPGADPWEKFGHNFIEVDDANGFFLRENIAFNWGVFDFSAGIIPFGWHFIQGKLMYRMEGWPAEDVTDFYINQAHRYGLRQELHFTPAQKFDLIKRLRVNSEPENREYKYDYFLKNCSTMTRDAIDQTVSGQVRQQLTRVPTGTTYRWHDRRTTADVLWLYVFLDYSLGHGVDQPLDAWEEGFLPERLADHLKSVMVPDADGKMIPLVDNGVVMGKGIYPEREEPPAHFFWGFLAFGVVFGSVLAALSNMGRNSRLARWSFYLLGVVWSLVVGLLGGLMTFAYFTDHEAAKWNENWLVGNVLSLLLVVLIPACRKWPRAAKAVAMAVVTFCVVALLAKVTPWFYQTNGQIIAAALPVHAAIAWGVLRLGQFDRAGAALVDGARVTQPERLGSE